MDKEFSDWRSRALVQFTQETGITVRLLPAPESANDQLSLAKKLLDEHASIPDVYDVDVIWPGMLSEHMVDLKSYLPEQAAEDFPAIVASYTVNGRLVAMPFRADVGLLFYRTDLLRQYGYHSPPGTWDELEKMSATIQAGERAKGNKNFWGFVWQGARYEGLTCNALEWQASEGGGRIIEDDKVITVNNPRTVLAWQRAARWVGSISPPGVIAYEEWDAQNVWQAGNAAFMRNWPPNYDASRSQGSAVRNKFDVAFLPAGQGGRAHALGSFGLAIPKYSRHLQEAVALIRFLCRRDLQLSRSREISSPPTIPQLYDDPDVLKISPYYANMKQVFLGGTVSRPSRVTGTRYGEISQAYFNAVHSVLTGEKSADRAAADLEGQLTRITGFATLKHF